MPSRAAGALRQRAEERLALLDELDREAEVAPAGDAVVGQLAPAWDGRLLLAVQPSTTSVVTSDPGNLVALGVRETPS